MHTCEAPPEDDDGALAPEVAPREISRTSQSDESWSQLRRPMATPSTKFPRREACSVLREDPACRLEAPREVESHYGHHSTYGHHAYNAQPLYAPDTCRSNS